MPTNSPSNAPRAPSEEQGTAFSQYLEPDPITEPTMTTPNAIDTAREQHAERAAAELVRRLQQPLDSPERAIVSIELERLADSQLARTDLPDDVAEWWEIASFIADGQSLTLPRVPTPVDANLAEIPRDAPAPDRIVGLLCAEKRADLEAQAAGIPEVGRDKLAGMLRLELGSEGALLLLTEAERAAARLHADRENEREHLRRLTEQARAVGERIESMKTSPTIVGAPALRNF